MSDSVRKLIALIRDGLTVILITIVIMVFRVTHELFGSDAE